MALILSRVLFVVWEYSYSQSQDTPIRYIMDKHLEFINIIDKVKDSRVKQQT